MQNIESSHDERRNKAQCSPAADDRKILSGCAREFGSIQEKLDTLLHLARETNGRVRNHEGRLIELETRQAAAVGVTDRFWRRLAIASACVSTAIAGIALFISLL